jgi:hypothetical protein
MAEPIPVDPPTSPTRPWYRRPATFWIAGGLALVVTFVLALGWASAPVPAPGPVAAPAPAEPALTGTDAAFITELTTAASSFGAQDPARAGQLVSAAKTDCGYLRTNGIGRIGAVAQNVTAQGGYSLAESMTFALLAVKHFCPEVNNQPATTTPVAAPVVVADTPPNTFSDGTYLVGTDMPAGNYTTDGTGSTSGSCYWSRNKNDGGSAGNIIKNNVGAGPGRYTAQKGEIVILSLGCTWTKK